MKRFVKVLCVVFILMLLASPSMAMTEEQKTKCHWIIHSAATAAAGSAAALAQAPGTDNAVFVGIMGAMAASLAVVFDIDIENSSTSHAWDIVVMTIMAQVGGAMLSRTVSQWLVGWIPVAGNAINSASMAAMVEFVGWKIAEAYDNDEFASIGLVKRQVKKYVRDSLLGDELGEFFDLFGDSNSEKGK